MAHIAACDHNDNTDDEDTHSSDEDDNKYYDDKYLHNEVSYDKLYEERQEFYEDSTPAKPMCDSCDRDFPDEISLGKHMAEHIVCRIDGCTFTAHQKVVELHVKMQHTTGLFEKIKSSTPDADKKWLDERKRSFPCAGKSTEKKETKEAMLKRGERLTKGRDRFGRRNNNRFERSSINRNQKTKNKHQNRPRRRQTKKESLVDDKSDWNGVMFPFKGVSSLLEDENCSDDNFSDNEWIPNFTPTSKNEIVKPNNALGALMGAYNSSDDSDTEEKKTQAVEKPMVVQGLDDEAPAEEMIERVPDGDVSTVDVKATDGGEKLTRKRKRSFSGKQTEENKSNNNLSRQRFRRRKKTLLEGLLENEIRHERNVLLQCVRYIVNNNFFG